MHKKSKILTTISVFLLIFCAYLSFMPKNDIVSSPAQIETEVYIPPRNAAPEAPQNDISQAESLQIPCEERFISMLNLNVCFNISDQDVELLATCAAVSLSAYSYDAEGYGICVNSALIEGFVESFYGININVDKLQTNEAPIGYIRVPECGFTAINHSFVSMNETDSGYEVITSMKTYYGGNDVETLFVKSLFIRNPNSEFGFNLKKCEIL